MKNLAFAVLLDFYEAMLTQNQRELLDLYYNNDYSLSEIAQLKNISRQAVLDNIKRGENALLALEDKLQLNKKYRLTMQKAQSGLEASSPGSREAELFHEIIELWEET